MATDVSRILSNPLHDYSGVQLKQGAVLLDSDLNELNAILDRRLRALAGDVLGRATVGANTPDAFRITLGTTGTGAQTLNIGIGRLYVDGLLAENHGAADKAGRIFDDLMGEERFAAPMPYEVQPYLPAPPPLPTQGRHLVYLDTWNREVTQLENPALVEPAVGVETGSRLQTVWQVRVLEEVAAAGTTCGSPDADLEGWSDLIAPSTGRLTTGTYEVAAVEDPCELPPSGGYRGLENQLYRVEIHDAGQPGGKATFKWSRENASVGSRVSTMISAAELELESLGRDDVLRFNTGDWVEILDDVREFAQQPGEVRSITVANTTRRITLNAPLPADMLPGAFPDTAFPQARNLRVRLWSQRGVVLATAGNGDTSVFEDLSAPGANGLIPVPAAGTTLLLENGVTVSFDSVGAKGFRSGDYWVFAARTADASVEKLERAAPRGIHHHYARLSLWDAGTTIDPTDCRHPWPPAGGDDCGCTQCVTPQSHASGQLTLQDAIQRVQQTGGKVCLHVGQYVLNEPVRLTSARSVTIEGQGLGTILIAPAGAFSIEAGISVVVEKLAMITTGKVPAISVSSGAEITLQELIIVVANPGAPASAIALSGTILGLTIRDNLISGPFGIRAADPGAPQAFNFLMTSTLRIENNQFSCQQKAIDISGTVWHLLGTQVRGNDISGCGDVALSMLGSALIGSGVRIENNTLNVHGPGIRCANNFAWIEGNRVTAQVQNNAAPSGSGIALVTAFDPTGSDQCQLLANQVSGFPDAGILITAPVQNLICKLNIIEQCGNGILLQPTGPVGLVSIENNHLRNIGLANPAPPLGPFVHGISVRRADAVSIIGNTLRGIGVDAVPGIGSVAGIANFAVNHSRINGNEIAEIGPFTGLTGATLSGISLLGPSADNEVQGNRVARDAAPAAADAALWSSIRLDEPTPQRPIVHLGDFTAVALTTARMLVLDGIRAFATEATLDLGNPAAPVPRLSAATLRGNVLLARGNAPVVSVTAGADVQFGDNRCELTGKSPVVTIDSNAAVVSNNIIRGGSASLLLGAVPERVTVLGNATTGAIVINQQPLANVPWGPFNARI